MKITSKINPHIKPDPVAADLKRVGLLIERDDPTAESEARKLADKHPNRADAHNILAVAYTKQNKLRLAVPHFEFAAKAEPNNAHYLNNLGRLYLDLGLVELALPFLQKALAIKPGLTSALLAIGKYYLQVGKAELATPYLERLHKLVPHDNHVKFELADSLDAQGRKQEADSLYQELRRTQSHLAASLYYFARTSTAGEDTGLVGEIEQLLLSDNLSDDKRSKLHTALGFIHERGHDYPRAFRNFDQANRLRDVPFDIDQYRSWVDGIIDLFTPDMVGKYSSSGSPSSLPVLVVGMPRSGTTLTEQVIASHGEAGGAGELARLRLFARKLSYNPQLDLRRFLPSLDAYGAKGLREMGENYVELLKFHAPGARRVVDKLPHNFQYLGFAALLCPNLRVVHCSRNPMDTCWSCFQNPLNKGHSYSKNLTNLGLFYREYRRLMKHWQTVLPLRFHQLEYEKLTQDFESEARKVIDFLDLPWDDSCLRFNESGRTVRTFSRRQVRSPIYRTSVERWRNYETELEPLLAALGDCAQ